MQRVPIPIAREPNRWGGREGTSPTRTGGEDPGCRGNAERNSPNGACRLLSQRFDLPHPGRFDFFFPQLNL